MAGRTTDSFFKEVGQKWTGPVRIWVFAIALAAVIIGANFFMEDTWSSYQGIRALEVKYELNSVTWDETYWSASLAAQVVQMLAMYIYLTNTRQNKKWVAVAVAAFAIDFALDAMYRANGYIGGPERLVAIGANTMIFSALSEVFITIGIGAALTLFPGAIAEFFALFGIKRSRQKQQPQNGQRSKPRGKQNSKPRGKQNSKPPVQPQRNQTTRADIERQMERVLRGEA